MDQVALHTARILRDVTPTGAGAIAAWLRNKVQVLEIAAETMDSRSYGAPDCPLTEATMDLRATIAELLELSRALEGSEK